MLELADDVVWVSAWRRLGDPAAPGSPFHSSSRSLTAIDFPGALRSGR